MTDPNLELHSQNLARLARVTGWVALGGPWLFAAMALGAGLHGGVEASGAVGIFFLLQAVVMTGLWATLQWRSWVFVRMVENPVAGVVSVPPLSRLMPFVGGLLGIVLPFYSLWAFALAGVLESIAPWVAAGGSGAVIQAWGLVLMGVLSALFAQYFSTVPHELSPEARGAACWFRAGTWISVAGAAALFIQDLHGPLVGERVVGVLLGANVVLGGELLARALWASWRGFYDEEPHPGAGVGTDLMSLRLLCSSFNPSASLFGVMAETFGIDLRGAWALTFMRRSMAPIGGGLILVGWASTSFVMVEASDVGLVERFGRLDRAPLRPGLHMVLPWPMHEVTQVPVHRVQTIPIGFTGAREDASMLWTVSHADEEYKLLLGDGRDLVTINASLHYRISDPFAYVYSEQQPDETLAILADRVLMQRTVGRSLDGVLSENLASLGAELEQAIQDASDARALGFEIVDLTITGLHPPVSVAADYQAVVAARVDQTTRLLEAEAYRVRERPRAEGEVARIIGEAKAHEVTRLATARGEAMAFDSLRAAFLASPEVFGFVRYLKAVEEQLAGKAFHVLDHTIEEAGGAVYLRDER